MHLAASLSYALPPAQLQQTIRTAATHLAAALQSEKLTDPAARSKVLAGLARVAALDPLNDTLGDAKELVEQAQKVAPVPVPSEVRMCMDCCAAAYVICGVLRRPFGLCDFGRYTHHFAQLALCFVVLVLDYIL